MKKLCSIILILTLGISIHAQDITTYQSRITKEITIGQASTVQILDASLDRLIILTNKNKRQSTTSDYKPSDYMILDVDSTLYLNSKFIIKDSKNKTLIAHNVTKDYIVLLFRELQSKQDIITRIKIDKDTIHEISRMDIDTIPHHRNDDVYFWSKSSPSKNYSSYTYVIANDDKWNCKSIMLDKKMDIIWQKEPKTYAINDIAVTDNAELRLIGSHYELESSFTNFYYEAISNKKQFNTSFTINDILLDAYIIKTIDTKTIISGNIYAKESPKKEIYIGGMYNLIYNDQDNSHNLEVRDFSHEDLCVLYNKDIDSKKMDPMVDNLTIEHIASTDNGNIITAQRQISTTRASANGTNNTTFFNYGILAMMIDNNGHLVWERPLRHQQSQLNGFHYLNYALFTCGDNAYIIQSESTKIPQDYNNNKATKFVTPTADKTNTSMYKIDKTGAVTKQILSSDDKSAIYGTCPKWFNNHYFYILGYSDKCKLLTIKRPSE